MVLLGIAIAGPARVGVRPPRTIAELGGRRVHYEKDLADVAIADADRNRVEEWDSGSDRNHVAVLTGPLRATVCRGDPCSRPVFTVTSSRVSEEHVGGGMSVRVTDAIERALSFNGQDCPVRELRIAIDRPQRQVRARRLGHQVRRAHRPPRVEDHRGQRRYTAASRGPARGDRLARVTAVAPRTGRRGPREPGGSGYGRRSANAPTDERPSWANRRLNARPGWRRSVHAGPKASSSQADRLGTARRQRNHGQHSP